MKKILVVDDERLNINVLVELLKDKYKMMAAKNGEQALKAVRSSNKPDLILLDIMMPDMDGYEVCRLLKEDPETKDIPVIFISAMSEVTDETKGFELGAVDYITKPISPAVVQARVKTHIALQEATELVKQHSKRMEDELTVARDIQLSMVPKEFPVLEGIDIFARLEPAREVGGDLYDVFMIDNELLCLCVGDVSGKGAPAAIFMAMAKTLIKSYASSSDLSTASIMTRVNDELCEGNDENLFVTVFLSILNMRTGELKFTNAGHNFPYIIKDDKSIITIDEKHGPIVAAMDGLIYKEGSLILEKNDTLFLFTDGVTESLNENEELYGEKRLEDFLRNSNAKDVKSTVNNLMENIYQFENGTAQTDDITILSCLYTGQNIVDSTDISIANKLENLEKIVDHFDQFCKKNNIGVQYNQKVNLSLDDLVNNIISYGYKDDVEHQIKIKFELFKSNLMITVEDDAVAFNPFDGDGVDTTLSIDEREIGGLGIHLIQQLMTTCSYMRKANKNIVTLTIDFD